MGYIREYCQECQKEHLKRTVCDEAARPVERVATRARVNLTAKQLREALEYANPDGADADEEETEIVIEWMPARTSVEGEHMAAGYYLWYAEYPEEGVIGPL
nr:hypothetical protein 3 [Gammaproteobacteria bacterium]